MAYYGQQPSGQQLQQGAGGNPFYNPYSAYPNIGMGISSILQNVMAQRQFQEQQTYDRGQEEKNMALKERQVAAQEQPTIRPTPEWEMEIQAYMRDNPTTNGKPTTQWDAIKGVTEGKRAKTDKVTTAYPPAFKAYMDLLFKVEETGVDWETAVDAKGIKDHLDEWQLRGRGDGTRAVNQQIRSDKQMIDSISARFDKEVGRFSSGILGILDKEGTDTLRVAQAELDKYRNLGRVLTKDEKQEIRAIGKRMPKIRKYGAVAIKYDFDGTIPEAGLPNGAEIKTTPEGYRFVKIGGRILLVQ